ncbi:MULTISPECIES: hypothetical protein [Ruegeria]|uniref:GYD domain protein n=1 Tax=Ruegeria atlantica TaxID=81569 RepID=A0A0P1E1X7_9RHOB|nr:MULTISPECIES: hypothetical protein [Ruegeria]CUH42046.1 hypothetical protein RUM4293_00931 [Ruegeria atlantica]CUH48985.1 hypothetical protein RUA4292_03177 [Ruegeria atlantica]
MKITALVTAFSILATTAHAEETTRYMLEGIAEPSTWGAVLANPQDRGANAEALMNAAGCELIDYYFGMFNYKSYVVIQCPKSVDISPIQIIMFGAGTVDTATATPIVTTAEMVDVAKAAQKISGAYGGPSE